MPFGSEFGDVYARGIEPACQNAGADCFRVDELVFNITIIDSIHDQIKRADVIIADMTGNNPNVMYEVGFARGRNKSIVLLTQDLDGIPFDQNQFHHCEYDSNRPEEMHDEVARRIRAFAPAHGSSINVDLDGSQLKEQEPRLLEAGNDFCGKLTLHNTTSDLISKDDYTVGVVFPQSFSATWATRTFDNETIAALGDGRDMALLSCPSLPPNGHGVVTLRMQVPRL
jgi:hypothetical protein